MTGEKYKGTGGHQTKVRNWTVVMIHIAPPENGCQGGGISESHLNSMREEIAPGISLNKTREEITRGID